MTWKLLDVRNSGRATELNRTTEKLWLISGECACAWQIAKVFLCFYGITDSIDLLPMISWILNEIMLRGLQFIALNVRTNTASSMCVCANIKVIAHHNDSKHFLFRSLERTHDLYYLCFVWRNSSDSRIVPHSTLIEMHTAWCCVSTKFWLHGIHNLVYNHNS